MILPNQIHPQNLKDLGKQLGLTEEERAFLPQIFNGKVETLDFRMLKRKGMGETQLDELGKQLEPGIFRNFPYLKDLNLSNISRKTLPLGLLDGLMELKTLVLDHMGLLEVEEDLLKGVPQLEYLSLISNRLTELPEELLASVPHLQQLDLADNRIRSLPPRFLRHTPKLEVLNLINNRIRRLHPEFLRFTPRLDMLQLSNNQLESVEGLLDHLEPIGERRQIYVDNNLLKWIPLTFMDNIKDEDVIGLGKNPRLRYFYLTKFKNLREEWSWYRSERLLQEGLETGDWRLVKSELEGGFQNIPKKYRNEIEEEVENMYREGKFDEETYRKYLSYQRLFRSDENKG